MENTTLKIYFKWQSIIYFALFFFWIFRYVEGVWLSDLVNSPYIKINQDIIYWALFLNGIPQIIISNLYIAYSCDFLILLGFGFLILRPQNKFISYAVVLLYFLYFIIYNSSTLHHTHSLIACLFTSIILCFKSKENFKWAIELFRLYACYAMVSAALWKIARKTAFEVEQLSNILVIQHISYILDNPYSFKSNVLQFLIDNSVYSYAFWIGAIALELLFLIGFFTKKYDLFLLIALLTFVVADYWLMDLYFWEFCLFGFFFFNMQHAPYPLSQKMLFNSTK